MTCSVHYAPTLALVKFDASIGGDILFVDRFEAQA